MSPPCCATAKDDIIAFTRARSGLLFASSRSAAEPCRSPRVPFLYAYCTTIGRPWKYYPSARMISPTWPFMLSMTKSELSKDV